jgi:hypothetical protein
MIRKVETLTVRGRTFSREELARIQDIVVSSGDEHRFAISKKVCVALGWLQENGRPKDRSCRELLRKLDGAGIIRLPLPRRPPVHRCPIALTPRTEPRLPFAVEPKEVGLGHFAIVTGNESQERLWNEFIERYHYLRFGVVVGPQIKYIVQVRGEPVACLSFGGAAWKVEARDRWIGWASEQRKRNLRYVVNNTRYLLLPWARVKNLASRILALAARRLPDDWHARYGYHPILLETFVHTERHAGTCYRAANWIMVGETKGRGRMDRHGKAALPRKAMFVHPLVRDARQLLTLSAPPTSSC